MLSVHTVYYKSSEQSTVRCFFATDFRPFIRTLLFSSDGKNGFGFLSAYHNFPERDFGIYSRN